MLGKRMSNCRPVRLLELSVFAVVMWGQALQAEFRNVTADYGFDSGGLVAFADYDGDGWTDVYAGGPLYRNEGGKRFVNVTEQAGLEVGDGMWGDFDNDGDPDLFIRAGAGALHRNQGDGTFEKVSTPPLPTVSSLGAVWADLNNDGWLDLYVGGYEAWEQEVYPDAILVSEGGRSFREHWRSPSNACYSTRGVTAADFDEDGDTDIYTSHYRLQPNFLYRNDGGPDLKEVAVEYGAAGIPDAEITYTGGIKYKICGHSIGSAFGDLDNDGHIDLFLGNFSHPPEDQDRPQFLRNRGPDGNFRFEDMSEGAGLAWQESFASPALGDYDNDGDLDLFYTTVYATGSYGIKNYPVLYRNEGDWKFVDVTEEQGVAKLGETYQAGWADIDNDGDLDLFSNGKLFLNENKNKNHWLKLKLSGDGKQVNRSAIGAQVRIRAGGCIFAREVEGGTGQGNQNDLTLHFGLGGVEGPVDLEISWPGGAKQSVKEIPVDRQHHITFKPS
jgi:hypothetical protein